MFVMHFVQTAKVSAVTSKLLSLTFPTNSHEVQWKPSPHDKGCDTEGRYEVLNELTWVKNFTAVPDWRTLFILKPV